METAVIEVTVMVAVSEDGNVLVSVLDNCNVQRKRNHEAWLQALREDKKLWTLKTIKTLVPLPVQYDEIDA
jgi:hypothetical protein